MTQREIKFRAYDTVNKEWVTERLTTGMRYDKSCPEMAKDQIAVLCVFNGMNQCAIMQFTGLKDKDGREIYEGDIVRYQASLVPLVEEVYQTVWYQSGFGFKKPNEDDHCVLYLQQSKLEILGNIYENPELLT